VESHILNGSMIRVVAADSGGWWVTFHDCEDLPTLAAGIKAKVEEVAKGFAEMIGPALRAVQPPREAWQETPETPDGDSVAAFAASMAQAGGALTAVRVVLRRVTCGSPAQVAACVTRATEVRTRLLDLLNKPFGVKLGLTCHDEDCPMRG